MEFLHRDEAPLTQEQWKSIDDIVVKTARKTVVGRKFIEITPVLDPSIQHTSYDIIDAGNTGACGLFGEKDCGIIKVKDRKFLPLPIIYQDFKIHWRDIESSKKHGIPLDLGVPASAASKVSIAEDRLIFLGDSSLGYPGLLNVEGRNTVRIRDWNSNGEAFRNAVEAVEKLTEKGFYQDYALVLNPKDYAKLHRVLHNTGVLEISQIKELYNVGVFTTPAVPQNKAVAVATGIENMDIFVAQDMITAYVNYDNMDHYFRIFEILALRIKRPESICTIE